MLSAIGYLGYLGSLLNQLDAEMIGKIQGLGIRIARLCIEELQNGRYDYPLFI
jgi:hypothetical protein